MYHCPTLIEHRVHGPWLFRLGIKKLIILSLQPVPVLLTNKLWILLLRASTMERSNQPERKPESNISVSTNGFANMGTTPPTESVMSSSQHEENGASNTLGAVNPNDLNVSVSQEQKLEVYNILAMIKDAAPTASDNEIAVKNDNADIDTKFEGEYNSCDEDGKALPINDDDDVPGVAGGLNSREMSAAENAASNGGNATKKTTLKKQSSTNLGNTSSGAGTISTASRYYFGKPKQVQSIGKFTELGSILGPFFCLGQLGKGTFSSIHKCICMNYFHRNNDSKARRRLAAAKVELVSFQQSGVLEAEATILDYLHNTLPPGTVPVYMGHYRADPYAAIFMEYLPGEDMHQLREKVMAKTAEDYELRRDEGNIARTNVSPPTRRINANDAVYLTADVMLPLLQRMHEVGVVHRDVKPSNCVRAGTGSQSKQFCMVDFGLSKSIIVPEDNEFADKGHYWNGEHWLKPYLYQNMENPPRGCYREERKKADFRGTSMYASLRVHQERDYCPRDDVWSLLYVFCDLVTGGLPWMQHAANRDRDACQRYKERIHGEIEGEGDGSGDVAELLKGDLYHKSMYQREKSREAGVPEEKLPPLPSPLALCKDQSKISYLTKAFSHVAKLQFWEQPDYRLIQNCIRGFLQETNKQDPTIRQIKWEDVSKFSPDQKHRRYFEDWKFLDDEDPLSDLTEDIFEEAEKSTEANKNDDGFVYRIPVQLRFRIAQMDYNQATNRAAKDGIGDVPIHRALNDWFVVTLELLYKEWDARRFESGGHRTAIDSFKRECYLQLLEKCRKYAKKFHDFGERDILYFPRSTTDLYKDIPNGKVDPRKKSENFQAPRKKRRVSSEFLSNPSTDLILVSKCVFGLEIAIRAEQAKKSAPPVRISFG